MIACLAGPVATSSSPLFSMAAMPEDTIMPDATCSGAITMHTTMPITSPCIQLMPVPSTVHR